MSRLGKNARFGPSRRNFNRPAQWRRATVDAAHDRRPTMVNHIAARSSSAGRATVTLGIRTLCIHITDHQFCLHMPHTRHMNVRRPPADAVVAQGKSLAPGTLSTPYEKTIPWDVRFRAHIQVTIETLLSFVVLAFGCAMTTPALREIDWSAELRDECVHTTYPAPSTVCTRARASPTCAIAVYSYLAIASSSIPRNAQVTPPYPNQVPP